jgi:hypothetical protein
MLFTIMRCLLWYTYVLCNIVCCFVKVNFLQSVSYQQMCKVCCLGHPKFEVIGAVKELHV